MCATALCYAECATQALIAPASPRKYSRRLTAPGSESRRRDDVRLRSPPAGSVRTAGWASGMVAGVDVAGARTTPGIRQCEDHQREEHLYRCMTRTIGLRKGLCERLQCVRAQRGVQFCSSRMLRSRLKVSVDAHVAQGFLHTAQRAVGCGYHPAGWRCSTQ